MLPTLKVFEPKISMLPLPRSRLPPPVHGLVLIDCRTFKSNGTVGTAICVLFRITPVDEIQAAVALIKFPELSTPELHSRCLTWLMALNAPVHDELSVVTVNSKTFPAGKPVLSSGNTVSQLCLFSVMPPMPSCIVFAEPGGHVSVPVTLRVLSWQKAPAVKECVAVVHALVVTPVIVSSKAHVPRSVGDPTLGVYVQSPVPVCMKVADAVPSPLPISRTLFGVLPPGCSVQITVEPVILVSVLGMPKSKQKSGLSQD
jgi:hypothetical protein